MGKLAIVLGLFLAVFSIAVAGGYALAGVPGAVGGLVIFIAAVKGAIALVKKRFKLLAKSLFESKSRVLRGATATLHSIDSAPEPDGFEAEEGREPGRFMVFDVTINPQSQVGPFNLWDPEELELVRFEAPARDFDSDAQSEADAPQCVIHGVSMADAGGETADKTPSAQRLKLHVEVPPGVERLKFQYYFESFGDLQLPRE